jgi:transcriptional regulator
VYVNPHFKEDDLGQIHDLIEANPFGVLVSARDGLRATHIPFVLHRGEGPKGTLVAHTARADPIWRGFDGKTDMLAIFQGPRSYIRARWYAEVGLPTYNFIAVHVSGRPWAFEEEDLVVEHLDELVRVHETDYKDPWFLEDAPQSYVRPLLSAIAPFTMEIERIRAKVKVSQNRSAADREGVRRGLRKRGHDDDVVIAEVMDRYPYASDEGRSLLEPVLDDNGTVKVQEDWR